MYLVRHSKVEYRHKFRHEDVEHRQGPIFENSSFNINRHVVVENECVFRHLKYEN